MNKYKKSVNINLSGIRIPLAQNRLNLCRRRSDWLRRKDIPPVEKDHLFYFKYLREEKHYASSSMWTHYSMLNCVVKNIYGIPRQPLPRITPY